MVLFNPGIWGYNDWIPTLHSFFDLSERKLDTAYLFTSYTIEEAEDDYDLLAQFFSSSQEEKLLDSNRSPKVEESGQTSIDESKRSLITSDEVSAQSSDFKSSNNTLTIQWLWECEVNPEACTDPLIRVTQSNPDRIYYDNKYWHCFKLN